jgi:molecular chaperone DnaK
MRTIGIDLGTTNTVLALDGTVVQHFTGGEGHTVVPSVVAFPPSGAVLVGGNAKKRRAIDPKNTIFSAKRLMGQSWHSYVTAKFRRQYPFDLVEKDGAPAFKTRLGTFAPHEVGAKLIERAVHELMLDGARVQTVITVPAAFDERARQATRRAGEQAGLLNVQVIPEPVATALAYLTLQGHTARRIAVYDLGGGTFDLAVVESSATGARVLAHGGDSYLGGDDIDNTIADWVSDQVVRRLGWDLRTDTQVMDRLIVQCERAKVRLGLATQTRIDLAQVDPAAPHAAESITLEREVLESLSRDLVSRTFLVCDQVLGAAGLTVRDVDAVFMSGGTTLLPMVRDGVARYFGKLPRCDFDPMEVVATGASLFSADS